MVKRKHTVPVTQPSTSGGGDDVEEYQEMTEDTDDSQNENYDSVHSELDTLESESGESTQDDETIIVPAIVQSPQIRHTYAVAHNTRSKTDTKGSDQPILRRSPRLLKKRQNRSQNETPDHGDTHVAEAFPTQTNQSEVSAGIYSTIKNAIQEMTSQVVTAINTAFRGSVTTNENMKVAKTSKPQQERRSAAHASKTLEPSRKHRRASIETYDETENSSSDELIRKTSRRQSKRQPAVYKSKNSIVSRKQRQPNADTYDSSSDEIVTKTSGRRNKSERRPTAHSLSKASLENRNHRRSSRHITKYDDETETSSESEDSCSDFDTDSVATSKVTYSRSKPKFGPSIKIPAFTGSGSEKWEVWLNRFESIAELKRWQKDDKLHELLPRLQGEAADFVFDQLPSKILRSYKSLTRELSNRFGVIETSRTYKLQFSRRKQLQNETPEKFASELKRLYDKAYSRRDAKTRQEDLLQRFLLGLIDYKARIHIELNRDPRTIEEAVHDVVNYVETMKNPNQNDDHVSRKTVRQVKKSHKKETKAASRNKGSHENLSKLQDNNSDEEKTITMKETELLHMINKVVDDKKHEFQSRPFSRPNQGAYRAHSGYENQSRSQNEGSRPQNTQNGGFRPHSNSHNVSPRDHTSSHNGDNRTPNSQPNGGFRRPIVCYNCNQPGHIARNCVATDTVPQPPITTNQGYIHVGETNQGDISPDSMKTGQPVLN